MKKAILGCLLGVLMLTTVFVVYDNIVVPANDDNEASISSDEYGGPIRRMFQRRKQQRNIRRQRQQKYEIYTDVTGQQYVVNNDQ